MLILIGLLLLLGLNCNFRTIESLNQGRVYKFKVEVTNNNVKVLTVNSKEISKNYYIDLDEYFKDGKYELIGKILKINNLNIKVEPLEKRKLKNFVNIKLKDKVEKMTRNFPYDFQEFTKAVVLGEKNAIDKDLRDKFNYTGTSHILVISGFHIGLIIIIILFLLKNLPYQLRYFLSGIILTLYCYGIGFTPSVFRAYIMGIIYIFAKIFYEERDMVKALIISFLVSSFINPYSLTEISYKMSYLALIGILFLYPEIKKILKIRRVKNKKIQKILEFLALSFSIQIILSPIFLYYFRSLPVFSFMMNLIIIPLGGLVVQLLFISLLLSMVNLSVILIPTSYLFYKLLIIIIGYLNYLPYLNLSFFTSISLVLYVYLYGIIFLLIIGKIKRYKLVLIFLIPIIFINLIQRKSEKEFYIGYYKNTPNKVLITNYFLDDKEIFFLKDKKIHKLDYVISSKNQNIEKLDKAFRNIEVIKLNKGESIEIGKDIFINKGKIIEKKGEGK